MSLSHLSLSMSPVSAALFVSLAVSFSVTIPVFVSVPPSYFSVSSFSAFLPQSLGVYLHLRVSLCLSVFLSLCVCISLTSSVSLFLFPESGSPSLSASLCVFLPWSGPQPVTAVPLWPEPGAVLASAAPSRPPACPSVSRAGSCQYMHPTSASQ